MPVRTGEPAANFVALSTAGELDLYGWLGSRRALIAFCPPGMHRSNEALLNRLAAFAQTVSPREVAVLAVCEASLEELLVRVDRARTEHAIDFPLVADPERTIATAYGCDDSAVASVLRIDADRRICDVRPFDGTTLDPALLTGASS
jgi:peroxiredoxin